MSGISLFTNGWVGGTIGGGGPTTVIEVEGIDILLEEAELIVELDMEDIQVTLDTDEIEVELEDENIIDVNLDLDDTEVEI